MAEKKGIKIAAQNRKAFHDYFVEDRYEAGIELKGTEVKSIRAGTLNLKDSYVIVKTARRTCCRCTFRPTTRAISSTMTPTGRRSSFAQARDRQALFARQAGRLRADPAERLLQGRAREGRSRRVQG